MISKKKQIERYDKIRNWNCRKYINIRNSAGSHRRFRARSVRSFSLLVVRSFTRSSPAVRLQFAHSSHSRRSLIGDSVRPIRRTDKTVYLRCGGQRFSVADGSKIRLNLLFLLKSVHRFWFAGRLFTVPAAGEVAASSRPGVSPARSRAQLPSLCVRHYCHIMNAAWQLSVRLHGATVLAGRRGRPKFDFSRPSAVVVGTLQKHCQ